MILTITPEDLEQVENLFYKQQITVTGIIRATGYNKYKVARILHRIQLEKQLKIINRKKEIAIEPGEFERVYSTTYQNSNFVLLTNNESIKEFRKFLT